MLDDKNADERQTQSQAASPACASRQKLFIARVAGAVVRQHIEQAVNIAAAANERRLILCKPFAKAGDIGHITVRVQRP